MHALPRCGRRRPRLPGRALWRRSRRVCRPPLHVLRRGRGRASLLGGGGTRLDDRRRERDPRPGPRRVAGRGARGDRAAAPVADVQARGRVGQAGPHGDGHLPPPGVDPVGRGRGRVRVSRRPRRRTRPRHRRGADGFRARVDPALARCDRGRRREPNGRARGAARRGDRSTRDPVDRHRRHAGRHRCAAHVDRFFRGARRTVDGRDGDGVPRRQAVARRRRRVAPRRRSRRGRHPRRHAARPRRPEGIRATLGRSAAGRDRQGARHPRGGDRALPRRARGARGRAARHVAAGARRGHAPGRARSLPRQARPPRSRERATSSTRSRRASSTSCCTSPPCG